MRSWFQKQPHLDQHLDKRVANWRFLGLLEVQFICFVLALAAASRHLDNKTLDLPAISGSINNPLIGMTDNGNQPPPASAAPPAQPVFLLQAAEKTHDPFAKIQIRKGQGFPKLAFKKDGKAVRVGPGDITAWKGNFNSWGASVGAPGLYELAETCVSINKEGTRRLPSFEDHPEFEDLGTSIQGRRLMLAKMAGTRFGLHVSMPATATLSQHTDEKINKLFHNFTDMVAALSFRLL